MTMKRACLVLSILLLGIDAVESAQEGESASSLSLELISTKRMLLVDEPLVLTLIWSGQGEFFLESIDHNPYLELSIQHRAGTRTYRRRMFVAQSREPLKKRKLGERPVIMDVVIGFDAALDDWAFPEPGRYGIAMRYREPGLVDVTSNTLEVDVRAPRGREAEAHVALSPHSKTDLALSVNEGHTLDVLKQVVRRFPDSVYLHMPRVNALAERVRDALQGRDPDQSAAADPPGGVQAELRTRFAAALLPEAEEVSALEGPFQPNALYMLALCHAAAGNASARKATLERIVRDYPRRPMAERARDDLEDIADEARSRHND